MTDNILKTNKCFEKLSSEHQELWLNINQNIEWIDKFQDLDDDHYLCVCCFEDLGYDMPDGFFHSDGYCATIKNLYYIYCDECVQNLNLKIDNGIINGKIMVK